MTTKVRIAEDEEAIREELVECLAKTAMNVSKLPMEKKV
jgi:hypothetical protein